MALKKKINLTDIGLADVEVNAYINIQSVSVQQSAEGMMVHATVNVFTSEEARREGKNAIGAELISGPYHASSPVNIHTAVYNIAKTYPQFADAEDA